MNIIRANLETCSGLTGAVVVIDVLRSFSTAAYAFAAGARAIYPVASLAEAQLLQSRHPNALTMGAAGGGWPLPGFDLTNSPAALAGRNLTGLEIIHCTAAGVRGLVFCRQAETLLAASFVCAYPTVRFLRHINPAIVTLVATGDWSDRDGDEDYACADYLAALLSNQRPDPAAFALRVRNSDFGRRFTEPDHPADPAADLEYCVAVDCFDFALLVRQIDGELIMKAV